MSVQDNIFICYALLDDAKPKGQELIQLMVFYSILFILNNNKNKVLYFLSSSHCII